jgi:hypothetical protein
LLSGVLRRFLAQEIGPPWHAQGNRQASPDERDNPLRACELLAEQPKYLPVFAKAKQRFEAQWLVMRRVNALVTKPSHRCSSVLSDSPRLVIG